MLVTSKGEDPMDGKEMMKELYKYFGEKKEEDQEMHSIANIFYEMGTKEDSYDQGRDNRKAQELKI